MRDHCCLHIDFSLSFLFALLTIIRTFSHMNKKKHTHNILSLAIMNIKIKYIADQKSGTPRSLMRKRKNHLTNKKKVNKQSVSMNVEHVHSLQCCVSIYIILFLYCCCCYCCCCGCCCYFIFFSSAEPIERGYP